MGQVLPHPNEYRYTEDAKNAAWMKRNKTHQPARAADLVADFIALNHPAERQ